MGEIAQRFCILLEFLWIISLLVFSQRLLLSPVFLWLYGYSKILFLMYSRIFTEPGTEEIIWLHSHFCFIWKRLGATQSEIS